MAEYRYASGEIPRLGDRIVYGCRHYVVLAASVKTSLGCLEAYNEGATRWLQIDSCHLYARRKPNAIQRSVEAVAAAIKAIREKTSRAHNEPSASFAKLPVHKLKNVQFFFRGIFRLSLLPPSNVVLYYAHACVSG